MTTYTVNVLQVSNLTHDVKEFRVEKPVGYFFTPGQATEIAINKPGWETEMRPFTFTSLDELPYLEFIIKIYKGHNGMTKEMQNLVAGDSLIIGDAWGAIEYKGPGYFIAGGAGITPFIAILRLLHKQKSIEGNRLFFSNKTVKDVICMNELAEMLGDDVLFTITQEQNNDYGNRFINEGFLKKEIEDFTKPFYLCGPEQMVSQISDLLIKLGATPEKVVFEK
jgi:ferredoxin-NADP reductase